MTEYMISLESYNKWYYSHKRRKVNWERARKLTDHYNSFSNRDWSYSTTDARVIYSMQEVIDEFGEYQTQSIPYGIATYGEQLKRKE